MFLLAAVLASALFVTSDAGFVDTLPKCSIRDDDCLKFIYESANKEVGKTGIPELDMPAFDPMRLNNITATILDVVKVTVYNQFVKGLSKCVLNKFHMDVETLSGTQDVTCNVTIKGYGAVTGTGPVVQNILGIPSISTQGKGKVKIDNVKIHFSSIYDLFIKDGETYLRIVPKNIKYKYQFEKATFDVDKIDFANKNIRQMIIAYLNENSNYVMNTFGKGYIDEILKIYATSLNKFFEHVPTKNYIIENLAKYVKN